MFQLNSSELINIKSQTVICNTITHRKGVNPTVFLKNENLIVLYKNNTKYDKKIREIEERIFKIEKEKK